MIIKKAFIFGFLIVMFGCGNKYDLSQKKKLELIAVVDSLYEIDQGSRHKLYIPDSIYGLSEGSFMKAPNVLKDSLGANYDNYKKSFDSIVASMKQSDITNTIKLINITNKHGFPSNTRLGEYKAKAYMIFVHAPRNYYEQIESLILKEHEEKRISDYEKEYIFWHIKGRKGLPPMVGNNSTLPFCLNPLILKIGSGILFCNRYKYQAHFY